MACRFQVANLLGFRSVLAISSQVVGNRLVGCWAAPIAGKGADMNEHARAACDWRDESEALGVVPLGEFAFMAHGLSLLNQSIVREYHAQSKLFEFSKLLENVNRIDFVWRGVWESGHATAPAGRMDDGSHHPNAAVPEYVLVT